MIEGGRHEAAAPKVLVVDGTDVATSARGPASLARLESATGALRAALPTAECLVLVDGSLRQQLSSPEVARLEQLMEAGLVSEVAPTAAGGGEEMLKATEHREAAIVSNDTYFRERDAFPWLSLPDRHIGYSYGGDGWWVFMTRSAGARASWTGHDDADPRARRMETPAPTSSVAAPSQTAQSPRTYDDLLRSASPAVAIVRHDVVEAAAAVLFEGEAARPRDALVAEIVTRDLGLSMYGAAALLYRFEGSGIIAEAEPGMLARSADVTQRSAAAIVSTAILHELLPMVDGPPDEAAARRALGIPATRKASTKKAPAKAAKKAPTSTAAKKASATKAPAEKASVRKAPAKQASASQGPTEPSPLRTTRPRVRGGPDGTEWVVRCPACGAELVAPERAAAAARLASHHCSG